ncbi:hypothetical protein [Frankia sp. ArI3]|uniref:hypothetical protein n=1 Tax=Frankia sp. ArI3 TaxID=1858 RepID=UPI00210403E1|nr:hypothetical protein [Frankia sp. ArI3]
MAGDVPVDERALITPADAAASRSLWAAPARADATDPATGGNAATDDGTPAPPAAAGAGGERTLHRYGRVQVLGRPRDDAPGGPGLLAARAGAGLLPPADGSVVSTTGVSPGLNRAETLGLDAFRLRASAAYRRLKQDRPRDGHPWDMDRPCTDVPPPRGPSGRTRTARHHAPSPTVSRSCRAR